MCVRCRYGQVRSSPARRRSCSVRWPLGEHRQPRVRWRAPRFGAQQPLGIRRAPGGNRGLFCWFRTANAGDRTWNQPCGGRLVHLSAPLPFVESAVASTSPVPPPAGRISPKSRNCRVRGRSTSSSAAAPLTSMSASTGRYSPTALRLARGAARAVRIQESRQEQMRRDATGCLAASFVGGLAVDGVRMLLVCKPWRRVGRARLAHGLAPSRRCSPGSGR